MTPSQKAGIIKDLMNAPKNLDKKNFQFLFIKGIRVLPDRTVLPTIFDRKMSTINKWIRGEQTPTPQYRQAILRLLAQQVQHVPVSSLEDENDEHVVHSPNPGLMAVVMGGFALLALGIAVATKGKKKPA